MAADVKSPAAPVPVPAAAAAAPAARNRPAGRQLLRKVFFDERNQVNIRLFNAMLLALVASLCLRLAMVINTSVAKMRSIDFRITGDAAGDIREKTVLKKPEFYSDKIKKRDIFKMGPSSRPENMLEAGPSSKLVEATQNLQLVGISWSDDPDAMVEDTKAMKTFFVKRGQSVGEAKVENITREKVILRVGQETVDLR